MSKEQPIWTAIQTANSREIVEITQEDISKSYGELKKADFIVSVNVSKDRGDTTLQILSNSTSQFKNKK